MNNYIPDDAEIISVKPPELDNEEAIGRYHRKNKHACSCCHNTDYLIWSIRFRHPNSAHLDNNCKDWCLACDNCVRNEQRLMAAAIVSMAE